ncbi:MAG: hypothetical protein II543_06325 [Desulfovibrio sp.]|nr:hypothetical protein [Desulfovibrio sp.]
MRSSYRPRQLLSPGNHICIPCADVIFCHKSAAKLLNNIFKQSGANFGERIDWCEKCKAYLPTIDFRESEHVLDLDVLALGMMHLDMVAHDKQLRPLKVSFWNAL